MDENEFAKKWLPFAIKVAKRISSKPMSYGIPVEDFVEAAFEAVVYICRWINMDKAWDGVNRESYEKHLIHTKTYNECIKVVQFNNRKRVVPLSYQVSLQSPIGIDEDGEDLTYEDVIESNFSERKNEEAIVLASIMECCYNSTERAIIQARIHNMPYHEIGAAFGISRQRAHQIVKMIYKRVKLCR